MNKTKFMAFSVVVALMAAQTASAQFFMNDLTDATSVASEFTENILNPINSTWSYTNDYALAQDGTTNTVLQGGGILDWVTADNDTARSYLATDFANYMDYSWTARVAIEAPSSTQPWVFVGLGTGEPDTDYYNEPQVGQSVYVSFQSGGNNRPVRIFDNNNSTLDNTGVTPSAPGYDVYMKYDHLTQTLRFEIDNWTDGRFSGVDVATGAVAVDTILTDTSDAHIFFGGNAKVTWGDFEVYEDDFSEVAPSSPGNVLTVISNMAVEVQWSESGAGTAPITYNVKRSSISGSGYETVGSTENLTYTDTTVASNETYYYVVNASNAFGESANSSTEATGVGLPYDIFGTDNIASILLAKDNLFDNDPATYYDDYTTGDSYAGLDYGEGNAKQIVQVEYVLRDWDKAAGYAVDYTIKGANLEDLSDAVVLHTMPSGLSANPAINSFPISDASSYRYVFVNRSDERSVYCFAELDFITAADVTENGTSFGWLDAYYDVSGSNPSNFADYAEADVSDTDNDGLLAWQEYQLNGDPTDASSPVGVNNLYAWPEAPLENVVRWDASSLADISTGGGYIVYRSLDDSTYAAVDTVTTNEYIDVDVIGGETYFYKASVTNATYAHETVLSASGSGVANEYLIIGAMNNTGASVVKWFYNLFDRNSDTIMDDNAVGGWAGLDYGAGNAQKIEQVAIRVRTDSFGKGPYDLVIDGVTNEVNLAQLNVYGNTFEGSNDTNGNWTTIATITNLVPSADDWTWITSDDNDTAYRYVRYYPANGLGNYATADVEFLTSSDYTDKGTPFLWLEENELTAGDDELDTDADGHEAWQEFRAYTDPNDGDDVLKMTQFSITNGLVITWQSVEGIRYGIYSTENLVHGTPGLEETVIGLDGETSYTGTVSGASAVFYEIGVE